jgi:hypothetical protein
MYLGSNVARRVGKDDRLVQDQYQLSCCKQEFFMSAYYYVKYNVYPCNPLNQKYLSG